MVVNEIRKSKTAYFEKLENSINSDSVDPKMFWKASKSLLKTNKKSYIIPSLFSDGRYAETDEEKANILNDFFAAQSIVNDENKDLPPTSLCYSHTLTNNTFYKARCQRCLVKP